MARPRRENATPTDKLGRLAWQFDQLRPSGVRLTDLSKITGLSPATLSRVTNGKTCPHGRRRRQGRHPALRRSVWVLTSSQARDIVCCFSDLGTYLCMRLILISLTR